MFDALSHVFAEWETFGLQHFQTAEVKLPLHRLLTSMETQMESLKKEIARLKKNTEEKTAWRIVPRSQISGGLLGLPRCSVGVYKSSSDGQSLPVASMQYQKHRHH